MVLGHATVTAAGHRILASRWPWLLGIPLGPLLLGAYLPDMVDKSLSFLLGLSGRGYAHSLLVQALVLGGLWLLLPRRRRLLLVLGLGSGLHLLQDWVKLGVLIAPVLGWIPPGRFDPVESAWSFYGRGGPLLWLEVGAIVYWIGVAARGTLSPSQATQEETP